jgi:hypothetical protein
VFLNIINILRNNYFIEFYTKDKAIRAYILISIELELKKTRLTMIIYNKYLKIISLISLKLIPIKGYKFLVIFS